jgi:hypothetical protein
MSKVIIIEELSGPVSTMLRNLLRRVPDRDRNDRALQRLLAFRLRIDGEGPTREYLMRNIREMIQCRYNGRLYDFLKDDHPTIACRKPAGDPPESA